MRLTSYRPAPSRVKALSDPLQCTCWQVRSRRSVVRVLRLVILSVLLSLCSPAWASPTAEVVSIADTGACGAPMPGDQIALVVREGAHVLASLETCSSMGIATADVAASAPNTYVLLHTRDGHGTPYGAIYAEDLRVYQLAAGELVLCNRFRIGEPVDLFARWRYAYAATPSTGGGIRITLRMRVEIYEDEPDFDPEVVRAGVPTERTRVVEVSGACAAPVS